MLTRRTLALSGAILVLLSIPAGALAAGTTVSVRVEGAKRTLLATTVVHTHSGSITKDGAPKGSCPATDAVGALQLATHGHWGGTYSSSVGGIELLSIDGERYPFTSTHFWGFWVNNRFASNGICTQTLKKGDRLLFAPAPDKGNVFPTAIRAPKTASSSHAFKIQVVYYNLAGKARPLAKALVTDGKHTAITTATGYVTIHAANSGTYRFTATEKGYVRSAPVTVKVS
jgi:hypothetical protein